MEDDLLGEYEQTVNVSWSHDVREFRELGVQLDSPELREWWSRVESNSCLPFQYLETWEEWWYLMEILTRFDVSRIEKLYLRLPTSALPEDGGDSIPEEYQFGHVLLNRGSGFSALKSLVFWVGGRDDWALVGSASLAKALRSGVLRNLRFLAISPGTCTREILDGLIEGDVPHLTSLRVNVRNLTLDAAFRSPCFSKLRLLSIGSLDSYGWQSFIRAIQSGKLSSLTDFILVYSTRPFENMQDIAVWFSSLNSVTIRHCRIGSALCDLLEAILTVPTTELALKVLDLSYDRLNDMAVDALVRLADSGQLQHLERLDLSENKVPSKSLVTLVESIQRGGLPSLQILKWRANDIADADVEAIVEAYFKFKSLTTHIVINWDDVADLSLRTKLETYRDRNEKLNEKLLKLQKELVEEKLDGDTEDSMPLTSARVFICGYPEVGKTTLRKTLLHRFEKSPETKKGLEVENGLEVRNNAQVESGPEARQTPEVKSRPEVPQIPRMERSSEVVRSTAENTLNHQFGNWCSCLFRAPSKDEHSLPKEELTLTHGERSVASKEPKLPNEQAMLPEQGPPLLIEDTALPAHEPRTRGIEVSRIEDTQNGHVTTLVLWDLAGQEEYHLLHSAFLADCGSISGQVTTFILVLKASYEPSVEDKLLYWLRMLASSSPLSVKRHVMIVLNKFEGEAFEEDIDVMPWKGLIEDFGKLFDELDIFLDPFFIDVRKPSAVQLLRDHLFTTAAELLQGVPPVSRIVFDLQMQLKGWSEREKNKGLPILTWEAFEKSWQLEPRENHYSAKVLELGASILHEIGEIIYLKVKDAEKGRHIQRSVVVPNPEWFCRKVVGELLLPEKMFDGDTALRKLFDPDGSIAIARFQSYFRKLLVEGTQIEDLISILEHIGLCYRKHGEGKLIVPALIGEDDYSTIGWKGQGDEVMGRCLTIKGQERNIGEQKQILDTQDCQDEDRKYFIPAALFRRLQVELAHDKRFGGRGDSNYRVGKSFLSLDVGPLFVLVQFDVDPSDPSDDRIDILVEIRMDSTGGHMELKPVECICEIMQKLQLLCVDVCPGLKYDIKVIEPASASKRVAQMSGRKLMYLKEIKDHVVKGTTHLSWKTVGGQNVEPETCLSISELKTVVETVERKYVECQNDLKAMGLGAIVASGEGSTSNASAGDQLLTAGSNDQGPVSVKHFDAGMKELRGIVYKQADRIVGHIDKKFAELKAELLQFRQKHDLLVKEIQAQQSLFIADKVSDVPRYIFLSKKQQQQSWISITEAYRSTYELHFLCEGHDGLIHEVKGQEGIELRKDKEWLVKASPWLRWSLQLAVIVGKTVGNGFLPGLFSLIPDINFLGSPELAKAVDVAATEILEEGGDAHQVRDGYGGYGTAHQPVNLEDKAIAEAVVKDLKRELGQTEFTKKTRLARKRFYESDAQSPLVWICQDCIKENPGKFSPFSGC